MMKNKITAALDRKEIRDIFDIEFLLKKGVDLDTQSERFSKMLKIIDSSLFERKIVSFLNYIKKSMIFKFIL